jgi:Aerobic-type carbon monoxide dehydrogenase, small subunit CoxS/CutS homologs
MIVEFKLNDQDVKVDADSADSLLFLLREKLNLTGTKCGCEIGECGACTVIVDGRAVNSCLVLAGQLAGANVITIEGLSANGELDILQKAFVENHAVQCGFCTPGMIMSAKALLMKKANPTRDDIRTAISGNLCRCTGYLSIIAAIEAAAKEYALLSR